MEDCAMWTMIGTKTYKKCAQVYKLEERIKEFEAQLKDIRLELSCPETANPEIQKEPLYKWAALIMCIKHQQAKRIKQLEVENANWKKRYIEAVNDLKQALKG